MNSWNYDVIKGYANEVENERVNVHSMHSLKKKFHAFNIRLLPRKNLFKPIF